MINPAIVVAVDGTEPSLAAARWAAREARDSDRPLRILYVLDWDWAPGRSDYSGQRFDGPTHYSLADKRFDTVRRMADDITGRAAAEAREVAPGITVDTDVIIGNPAGQLVVSSEQADLMVLGSRGRGGFASLALGSVSQRVAAHAHCPVAVIRGRADAGTGPVAAGIDDAASSARVLEAAFTAARTRGASLTVIRSYLPVQPLYYDRYPPADVTAAEQDDEERARLGDQLMPWRAKYPDVSVEALLSHDTAAALLTGASHTAQLVIVGSHGHGVLAGTVIGSTGLQLLHHADCPVLIVRPYSKRDVHR
ncbi:universal stress protein [Actinoplanes sp. NBRC 101535]|uniref:universal stress protein n=1 Tax=Actinoplanes sp. NBRC 101535 TaxID=3032196 RepID=UPI0024A36A1A|nr:universal stress protein [Actinoplanes sp. NBRC 101535]GLY08714.1 universal stress protein [Actinoplanes sp. NBRC 101535]